MNERIPRWRLPSGLYTVGPTGSSGHFQAVRGSIPVSLGDTKVQGGLTQLVTGEAGPQRRTVYPASL